jgi:HAD superfamily hydrolase (TIGR01509 family)
MKYDVVMWDVDGTIIDSEALYNEAIRYASKHCGAPIDHISDEELCGLHMQDVWTLIQQTTQLTHGYSHWLNLLEDFYIDNQSKLEPIENSTEIIRLFHANGIEQVCVSNSSRKIIDINLARIGIQNEIKFIISVDDVEKGKPDPEPYLRALTQFQGKKALAVEDSRTGAISANAANITVAKYKQDNAEAGLNISHLNELKALVL